MTAQGFHRFGPFVIIRPLGRGGMGEVFLARTPWPDSPLAAVKRLRPDVARIPTFVERFRHEAALAVRLSHPNLVATLDVGAVDDQLYVASELVLGKDTGYIADRLRMQSQGGPAAVALRLILDGLAGLAYVHGATETGGASLELVHRDVTPGNLLVGYDGRARLADFGLAKSHLSERSRLTRHGEILGTPHYLPPEVVQGSPAIPASDIYGLGAVIYRFLTGVAPFQGTTSEVLVKVLSERPRSLRTLRPDLPSWMVELIEAMLAPSPFERPDDAGLLAEEVLARTRRDGLLVPRQAVGRWLAQLFSEEHGEELEERDRLEALDPSIFEPAKEGTVVLARAVEGPPPLSGPGSLENGGEEGEPGTELELSSSAVLGVSPPVEHDAAEMPTRAVEVHAGVRPLPRRDTEPGDEPDREPLPEPDDTDLDALGGKQAVGSLGPDDADPTAARPFRPGEGPLAPGASAQGLDPDTTLESEEPLELWARPQLGDDLDPAPATAPLPRMTAETSEPLLVTPVEDGSPQLPLPPEVASREAEGARPARAEARPDPWRRSALFLAGLLSLAVAIGIGLGKVVASLASPEPLPAPLARPEGRADAPPSGSRKSGPRARLETLSRRLDALQAEGRAIPPAAWRHVAQAASALLSDELGLAEEHLRAAESFVEGVARGGL